MENLDNIPTNQPLPPQLQQLDNDMERYLARPTWRKLGHAAGQIIMQGLCGAGRMYVPGVMPRWYNSDR
jgi:hypothetical protein